LGAGWGTAAELDGGDQLTVGADVELELASLANVEVRHDLWVSPDGTAGLEGELLVDRQLMDEGGRASHRADAFFMAAGLVDQERGAVLVVLAEVAVDVADEQLQQNRPAGQVLKDFEAAVVDESLGGVGVDGEHRRMLVGLANDHRHGEDGSGDGVLRDRHGAYCNGLEAENWRL
jgi:hypothetical protein